MSSAFPQSLQPSRRARARRCPAVPSAHSVPGGPSPLPGTSCAHAALRNPPGSRARAPLPLPSAARTCCCRCPRPQRPLRGRRSSGTRGRPASARQRREAPPAPRPPRVPPARSPAAPARPARGTCCPAGPRHLLPGRPSPLWLTQVGFSSFIVPRPGPPPASALGTPGRLRPGCLRGRGA